MTNSQHHNHILGGCHCGHVTFRCRMIGQPRLIECNCSICQAAGFLHWFVPHEHFELLSGHFFLNEYRFNTHTACHWFCTVCGIKSFYQPRSHPAHFSVNARCLRDTDWKNWPITTFDGQNWQKNIGTLS